MKNINQKYRIGALVLITAISMVYAGCKKFVDVDAPNSQLVTSTVYANDNTVKSALAGMFSTMANESSVDMQYLLSTITGNSADEMKYYVPSTDYDPFISNNIPVDNSSILSLWTTLYKDIYQANAIINGIESSSGGLSDAIKKEAVAEAKFVRAYHYFLLTNLWGDVPLAIGTNGATNNTLFRSAKADVYKQIIQDLTDARDALQIDYSYGANERIRPNKYAAAALLARVYLYTGDYANAQSSATSVINNSTLYSMLPTTSLGGIFVKNNTEAIFQLNSTGLVGFTQEGQNYAQGVSDVPYNQLTDDLVAAFGTGNVDKRYGNWVGVKTVDGTNYYYPFKYKQKVLNSTATGEYATYLRLAEQYLIRSEAMARQNNLDGAKGDLNVIRSRAGLGNTTATTQGDILLAIEKERRIELFGEYGQRWFDLKRTGRVDAVLNVVKQGWTSDAALYPIPKSERTNNINLSQNKGY